jgi:hypothetical protein
VGGWGITNIAQPTQARGKKGKEGERKGKGRGKEGERKGKGDAFIYPYDLSMMSPE